MFSSDKELRKSLCVSVCVCVCPSVILLNFSLNPHASSLNLMT